MQRGAEIATDAGEEVMVCVPLPAIAQACAVGRRGFQRKRWKACKGVEIGGK